MEVFKDIPRLQYIIGFIDGGHIPLFEKPNKKVIALAIEKKSMLLFYMGVCDYDKYFLHHKLKELLKVFNLNKIVCVGN
jgi:hypothetical protein